MRIFTWCTKSFCIQKSEHISLTLATSQTWLQEPCSTAPQLGQSSPIHGYLLLFWKCGHHPEGPCAFWGAQNFKYFQPVISKDTCEWYFLFFWLPPFSQKMWVSVLIFKSKCLSGAHAHCQILQNLILLYDINLFSISFWWQNHLVPCIHTANSSVCSEVCLLLVKCSCEHSAGSLSSFRILHLPYWQSEFIYLTPHGGGIAPFPIPWALGLIQVLLHLLLPV